jgi:hypothetical protein
MSDRLQSFRANDVLAAASGRTEYRLTEKGRAFLQVLIFALQWAQWWLHALEGPAVILTHTACARRFSAVLACDQYVGRLNRRTDRRDRTQTLPPAKLPGEDLALSG